MKPTALSVGSGQGVRGVCDIVPAGAAFERVGQLAYDRELSIIY